MDKKQLYELMAEPDSDNLAFLPEDVKKEIDELKEKIDAAYENSKIIKEYQIPQYNTCNEIIIIDENKQEKRNDQWRI